VHASSLNFMNHDAPPSPTLGI